MKLFCDFKLRLHYPALLLTLLTTAGCAVSAGRTHVPVADNETITPGQTGTDTTSREPNNPTESEPLDSTPGLALTRAGVIQTKRLREASGMAFSGNEPRVIWLLNDSGNAPELFAIDTEGRALATIAVNTRNRDWEDLSQFNFNGESFLLIADTGDNQRNQSEYKFHVLNEPVLGTRTDANLSEPLTPLVSFNLTLPDGSHNIEAAAVANDGYLYLITKAKEPHVYRAPLFQIFSQWLNTQTTTSANAPATTRPLQAEFTGEYRRPALPSAFALIETLTGVDLGSVTAFDVDNDTGEAWILTYRSIYKLPSTESGKWQDVLTGIPQRIVGHNLGQAEAMAFSPNERTVYITSEGSRPPLLKIE